METQGFGFTCMSFLQKLGLCNAELTFQVFLDGGQHLVPKATFLTEHCVGHFVFAEILFI